MLLYIQPTSTKLISKIIHTIDFLHLSITEKFLEKAKLFTINLFVLILSIRAEKKSYIDITKQYFFSLKSNTPRECSNLSFYIALATASRTQKPVYIPNGIYYIGSTKIDYDLINDIKIIGGGSKSTIIKGIGNKPFLELNKSNGVIIKNLTLKSFSSIISINHNAILPKLWITGCKLESLNNTIIEPQNLLDREAKIDALIFNYNKLKNTEITKESVNPISINTLEINHIELIGNHIDWIESCNEIISHYVFYFNRSELNKKPANIYIAENQTNWTSTTNKKIEVSNLLQNQTLMQNNIIHTI